MKEALPEHARGRPVEVWFQDEARVGQQGTLTRVWARRQAQLLRPDVTLIIGSRLGAFNPAAAVKPIGALSVALKRSSARSPPARTPSSSSTGRGGTAPGTWPFQTTSPCCRCRATVPS